MAKRTPSRGRDAAPAAGGGGEGSGAGGNAGAAGAAALADQAQAVVGQVQGQAGRVLDQARQQATTRLGGQKARLVEGLDVVAQALRQTGDQVRRQDQAPLAGGIDRVAGQVEHAAGFLRARDVPQLIDETQRFARRRPALFVGGALALGFVGARFLRSSAPGRGPDAATAPLAAEAFAAGAAAAGRGAPYGGAGAAPDPPPVPAGSLSEALVEARLGGAPLTPADYAPADDLLGREEG